MLHIHAHTHTFTQKIPTKQLYFEGSGLHLSQLLGSRPSLVIFSLKQLHSLEYYSNKKKINFIYHFTYILLFFIIENGLLVQRKKFLSLKKLTVHKNVYEK